MVRNLECILLQKPNHIKFKRSLREGNSNSIKLPIAAREKVGRESPVYKLQVNQQVRLAMHVPYIKSPFSAIQDNSISNFGYESLLA